MNLKNILRVMFVFSLLSVSETGFAQSVQLDNGKIFSFEEPVVASLTCQGIVIQFSKGMRRNKTDFSAYISVISPPGGSTKMGPSCYSEMSCVSLNRQPAVLIVNSPACGGNAVPEEYTVVLLKSMRKEMFSYFQAKKLGFINY